MSAFNNLGPGVYTWLHAGGSFPVALRPNGVFHCSSFPALASWQDEQSRRVVDWKQYGKYEFALAADGSCFEGGAVGNPTNWRKMSFLRPFTAPESILMAGPGGSAWDFQWEKVKNKHTPYQSTLINSHYQHTLLIIDILTYKLSTNITGKL